MRGRSSARTGGSVGARGISVVARRARERGGARADDSVPASRWTREWTLRHEPQRADTLQTSQRAVCTHAAQVRCQAHDRQRPVYAERGGLSGAWARLPFADLQRPQRKDVEG